MPDPQPSHATQDQFLDVIDRDEAVRRFHGALDLRPLEAERVPLADAWQRVLADDIIAPVDVPSFDRSNVDGFAVRAADTFGAEEEGPVELRLNVEELATGVLPTTEVGHGTATLIATGSVVPRGADAVVMVEHTDVRQGKLLVRRPATPGAHVTYAGTDIGMGETVLRRGELLTSRETGVLAAIGLAEVAVIRKPRVAILSTGNEVIAPGNAMRLGLVFDSNATILADAVRELGGLPVQLGIVPDDPIALETRLREALACDVVILSGGTSKGAGDISYRVVNRLGQPGIIVHGVALKPGKPLCLAAIGSKPLAILPGFPTSAIFSFHEFVAPVIRALAGRTTLWSPPSARREHLAGRGAHVSARLAHRVNSERGRTEFVLVGLVEATDGALTAFPMGKGSGSVTAFSRADGFVTIPRRREFLEAGEMVDVQLLGQGVQPADLIVVGSHCVGLDLLLGMMQAEGWRSKVLAVGSTAGLQAAARGECDLAGIHLFDRKTGEYNAPFLTPDLVLIRGYGRLQGIVHRRGDRRFEGKPSGEAIAAALADSACVMVNRNRGSGTRVLVDQLLGLNKPTGYFAEARTHHAVAAAVAQGRADWGVCIDTVALQAGLAFMPLQAERFDFVVASSRMDRPAVRAFQELLEKPETRRKLMERGFRFEQR
jgi:putative molybdopterin biosynthesis protein